MVPALPFNEEWVKSELPNKLLSRLKPGFHSLLQKMALSAGTDEVWPGLQTHITVSLLAVAASQSPSSSSRLWQLGTVGVADCDRRPRQSRGELRLAAFHSLTRSSVFTSL